MFTITNFNSMYVYKVKNEMSQCPTPPIIFKSGPHISSLVYSAADIQKTHTEIFVLANWEILKINDSSVFLLIEMQSKK